MELNSKKKKKKSKIHILKNGYLTWKNKGEIYQWLSGEIYHGPSNNLLLVKDKLKGNEKWIAITLIKKNKT